MLCGNLYIYYLVMFFVSLEIIYCKCIVRDVVFSTTVLILIFNIIPPFFLILGRSVDISIL